MKIKLLKDHPPLGKKDDEIDIEEQRGNYLVRMGVAGININDYDIEMDIEKEKITFTESEKEKHEFKPTKEKAVHTSLPTAIKKRGRKPKDK